MATTYKVALKLHQEHAGDENARVKISIGGVEVANNVEIVSTDMSNPDVLEYVASASDPGPDVSIPVKVELLNDLYIDSDNDRNVCWCDLGTQVAYNGKYYNRYKKKQVDDGVVTGTTEIPRLAGDEEDVVNPTTSETVRVTTYFVKEIAADDYTWHSGLPYTGDDNGAVEVGSGWPNYRISSTYVEVAFPSTSKFNN